MLRIRTVLAWIFLLSIAVLQAGAEVVDKIVVIVNDEVITQRELDRRIEPMIRSFRTQSPDENIGQFIKEAREKVLTQLIDDRLLYSEAKRKNITVSPEAIKEQVDKVKEQFNDEAEFLEALRQQSLTLDELKENYKQNMSVRKLVDTQINATISVSPAEVRDYYEKHKNEFTLPKMAKVKSIVIRTSKDRTDAEAGRVAGEVEKAIKAGQDFSELARKYSDSFYAAQGGDMGFIKEGEMKENINNVIFAMRPGQVSDIVKTDLGYHIFMVEEIKGQEIRDIETVNDKIEQAIFMIKFKEKMEAFMKRVKANAYIEFK